MAAACLKASARLVINRLVRDGKNPGRAAQRGGNTSKRMRFALRFDNHLIVSTVSGMIMVVFVFILAH
uniref:Transposase n=1 Tax=Ascaris lumbricoides TaxID=6252 RepID=A0A0M3HX80_ASCLU